MKPVVPESETLDAILSGKSIARYGDGEFNLLRGRYCCSQKHDSKCEAELRLVLKSKDPNLLVAIPRICKEMPEKKRVSWEKWWSGYEGYLDKDKQYYSAFITRPDQVPGFATSEYFSRVASLWRGKDVCLVWGGYRSLYPDFLRALGARSVRSVLCSFEDTYAQIDFLEQSVIDSGCRTAILCAGATATVLAARLSARGIHAIDGGHLGLFWEDHPLAPTKIQPPSEAMTERMRTLGRVRYVQAIKQHWPQYETDPVSAYSEERKQAQSMVQFWLKKTTNTQACVINNAGCGELVGALAQVFQRVYAFESDPGKFGSLRRNLVARNVWFFPYMLGNKVGDVGAGVMQTTLKALGLEQHEFLWGRVS